MHSSTSRKSLLCTAALAAVVVAGCSPDNLAPNSARVPSPRPSVNFAQQGAPAADWVVQLKTFSSAPNVAAAVVAAGGTVVHTLTPIGVMTVEGLTGPQLSAIQKMGDIRVFSRDRELQWVPTAQEMDATAVGDATDDVTSSGTNQSTASFFNSFQWGLKVTKANLAWAASPGGANRTVCILDSGIDSGHNDLIGKVVHEATMMNASIDARNATTIDYNLHGTFVSSIVSSRGIGVASMAPDARICSIKVLGVNGSGSFGDVIAGIMYAVDVVHADVINMSLGAYFDIRAPGGVQLVQALQVAVDYANSKRVAVVAASGNNGVNLDGDAQDVLSVPAQIRGVISVGATGPTGQANFDALASYSNYGGATGVALVAPGGGGAPVFQQDLMIGACSRFAVGFNCGTGRSYLISNGTSFASPMVAGAAAVLKSHFAGVLHSNTVRRCLTSTADNIGSSATFGAGRLNVMAMLGCQP